MEERSDGRAKRVSGPSRRRGDVAGGQGFRGLAGSVAGGSSDSRRSQSLVKMT